MKIKRLVQEHNTMTQPGVEPRPLYPKSSALTVRPLRAPMYYSLFVYDLFLRENPQCFKSPTSGYSVNATQWQGQQISYDFPLND